MSKIHKLVLKMQKEEDVRSNIDPDHINRIVGFRRDANCKVGFAFYYHGEPGSKLSKKIRSKKDRFGDSKCGTLGMQNPGGLASEYFRDISVARNKGFSQ